MTTPIDPPALHRIATKIGRELGRGVIDHAQAEDRIRACARGMCYGFYQAADQAPFLALMARLGTTMSRAAQQVERPDPPADPTIHAHLCAMARGRAPRFQLVAAAMTLWRGLNGADLDLDAAERIALAAVTATMAVRRPVREPAHA